MPGLGQRIEILNAVDGRSKNQNFLMVMNVIQK